MDYSPYYLKNYLKSDRTVGEKPKYNKPKRGRGAIKFIAFVLVVCLVIFAVDAFTDGSIYKTISGIVNPKSGKYYILIASEHQSETEAVASATLIRANGGAGYIIYENEVYSVALATYLEEDDAAVVQTKNQGTVIKEVEKKYSLLPDVSGFSDRCIALLDESTEKLYSVANAYSSKSLSAGSVLNEVTAIRNEFFNLKSDLLDAGQSEDTDRLISVVDQCFSAVEAVLTGGYSSTELESVLRYVTTLFAYCAR